MRGKTQCNVSKVRQCAMSSVVNGAPEARKTLCFTAPCSRSSTFLHERILKPGSDLFSKKFRLSVTDKQQQGSPADTRRSIFSRIVTPVRQLSVFGDRLQVLANQWLRLGPQEKRAKRTTVTLHIAASIRSRINLITHCYLCFLRPRFRFCQELAQHLLYIQQIACVCDLRATKTCMDCECIHGDCGRFRAH